MSYRFNRTPRLLLLLLCTSLAMAQTPSATQRITPNFQNVEISVVAEAVGAATNTSFIVDPRVRGQVSLINPRAMTPRELYSAFLQMLSVYNFAAVPGDNGIVKIVPDANIRTMPGSERSSTDGISSDEVVTETIDVRFINATQLMQNLRQLVSQTGTLLVVQGTNQLLITDRAGNVRRIRRIVQDLDRESSTDIDVIQLQNSTAAEVKRLATELLGSTQPADAAAGLAPKVVADDRTNSVFISGEPAQRQKLKVLIESLDAPIDNGGGFQVRYLEYADAETLAATLKEQATGIAAVTGGAAGGSGAAPTAAAGPAADRNVTIIPDVETNALIITAPPKMMAQLMAVVDKIDIPRAQVHIEAIIADVSTNKAADLGVNWAVFSNEDGTSVPAGGFIAPVGAANNNGISIVDLTSAILNPETATSIPLGTTIGIGRLRDNGLNFGAMIRALRADSNTNVIAEPKLTALDNQEATFEDAKEVPFLSGQYTNTGGNNNGNVNPFTTVNRQKVGTIMKVTPQINAGNAMMLTIELESSGLSGATGDAGSAITDTRKFTTTVLVEDGATIVLGGMIRNGKTEGESRVPFLGRIPLIGELFKVRNGRREQSQLMVFIRPKILTDSLQVRRTTREKYELIRDAQQKQADKKEVLPILPGSATPVLPELPPDPPATTRPVPDAATP